MCGIIIQSTGKSFVCNHGYGVDYSSVLNKSEESLVVGKMSSDMSVKKDNGLLQFFHNFDHSHFCVRLFFGGTTCSLSLIHICCLFVSIVGVLLPAGRARDVAPASVAWPRVTYYTSLSVLSALSKVSLL